MTEFARVVRDDGIMPYPVLMVGETVTMSFMNGYEDEGYRRADEINAAHASAVKAAVEKERDKVLQEIHFELAAMGNFATDGRNWRQMVSAIRDNAVIEAVNTINQIRALPTSPPDVSTGETEGKE